MAKRILMTAAVIFFLSAVCVVLYIFFGDSGKGESYPPIVDETNLATELKRLVSPANALSTELSINKKEIKAILIIECGLDQFSSSKAYTIKEIADRYSHGGYYNFPHIKEIYI